MLWLLGLFLAVSPARASAPSYLALTAPKPVSWERQAWEGPQFPHTLSVLELNRDGWRYWGWYGLSGGIGLGLARSNDLVHWTKYEQNPILVDARWPSALAGADRAHPDAILAVFERFKWEQGQGPLLPPRIRPRGVPFLPGTLSTYIVLAASPDGIHFTIAKTLVAPSAGEKNQNPNLFRDPRSGRYFLTWYRGDNLRRFEIVSRSAERVEDLDAAPEKVLLRSTETLAAPTLLYAAGQYYLATEIFPSRFAEKKGDWQTKVFVSDAADGSFQPVADNPVLKGDRACLFQHVFSGRFYGFDCHIAERDPIDANKDRWVIEEVEAPLP